MTKDSYQPILLGHWDLVIGHSVAALIACKLPQNHSAQQVTSRAACFAAAFAMALLNYGQGDYDKDGRRTVPGVSGASGAHDAFWRSAGRESRYFSEKW